MNRDEKMRDLAQRINDVLTGEDPEISASALTCVIAAVVAVSWTDREQRGPVIEHYFREARERISRDG